MQRVPQVLENATFVARMPLDAMPRMRLVVDRVEQLARRRGRVLVRWSGTEPKLRVMVEGEDEATIAAYAREIVEAAKTDVSAHS